jgi:hypothetical protein
MRKSKGLTRWIGAATLAAAGYASCSAPFDPPAFVSSLRVLIVSNHATGPVNDADNDGNGDDDVDGDGALTPADIVLGDVGSYARPGETVTFRMQYADGREVEQGQSLAPILVTWIGGCWNPPGNDYYGCYASLGERFAGLQGGSLPPEVAIGPGLTEFSVTVPDDVLAAVGQPATGPRVALGFVFFIVCAGELRFVQQEGDTEAGAFPLGCFDQEGRELGPDGFVPGYTQVYVFEDGRRNGNPVVTGLSVDDAVLAADAPVPTIPLCNVTEDERRKSGCSAIDEFTECETMEFDVQIPDDIAEVDADAVGADGEQLREVVWVSYYADGGDFDSPTKLLSDAQDGIQGDHQTEWVPPDQPGLYTIWAVVRDNRGGSSIVQQLVQVDP